MIMRKIAYTILLAATVTAAFAQRDGNKSGFTYKNAITWEPLYVFNNGFKINYERRIAECQWLEGSLIGYKYDDNYFQNMMDIGYYSDGDVDKSYGYGADLHYKYCVLPFMYASVGLQYRGHRVTTDYSSYVFIPYEEDGLQFISPEIDHLQKVFVQRYAASFRLGFQTRTFRRVSVGGFVGMSVIKSVVHKDASWNWYEGYLFDLTYSGLLPELGLKVGFRF